MLFQSFEFLAFLSVFILGILFCPRRLMLGYVTLASLYFYYVWYPPYIMLMLVMVVFGWLFSIVVDRKPSLLPIAICIVVLPLVFYKYTNFILSSVAGVTQSQFEKLEYTLPLGISFITFTVVSLLIDTVKLKKAPPSFLETSTYITFFPHLIAGPILRASSTIPQLNNIRFDWNVFPSALALFAVGVLKKVMIADPLGTYVDSAYVNIASLNIVDAAVAMLSFSVQIYCDFSAYTDMAIALAAMFSVKFPQNFMSPYIQPSITATWSCWHMTLTHWLRDYILVPIYSKTRQYWKHFAIVLTMLVSGLWHGANWTFVIWGLCHAVIIIIESETGYARFSATSKGLIRLFFVSINIIVWSFINVLFRSDSLTTALSMWHALFKLPTDLSVNHWHELFLCGLVLLTHRFDQSYKILQKSNSIAHSLLIPISLVIIIGGIVLCQGRPKTFYYFDF